MSRLNKVLKQNAQASVKKKNKKKTVIPVYDLNGKTITPEKKRRKKRIAITLLVFAAVSAFLYLPGFFMKDETKTEKTTIKTDTAAIRQSNTALRNHTSEDFDGDGLLNSEEETFGTDPYQIDTDGDGLTDYCEMHVTDTDPENPDDTLVDAQTKQDKKNEKKVGSPYKIGNVILWADDYKSKAYGSVVETTTGYRFHDFNGYAQFPDKAGKYAYQVQDGVRTELPYREAENAWKISGEDTVELYQKPLEEVVELSLFSHHLFVPSNPATDILAAILPKKGFFTSVKRMKADVEPDTRDDTVTDIVKPVFDSSDTYRFTIHSNTLNDLLFVRESIAEEDCCIAVSLFNEKRGEYLAIVYGYTYDGDLLLADMDTLKPIGTLQITENSKKMMDENGDMVSVFYFDFSGFGFSSQDGDRISFFAASSTTKNSHFGKDKEKKENTKEKKEKENTEEENADSANSAGEDTDNQVPEHTDESAFPDTGMDSVPTDMPGEVQNDAESDDMGVTH